MQPFDGLLAMMLAVLAMGAPTTGRYQVPDDTQYFRTEHFAAIPNNQPSFNWIQGAGGLCDRLEATYRAVDALGRRLGVATTQPSARLTVLLFNDPPGFENYAEGMGLGPARELRGFYDRESDRVVLLDFTLNGVIPETRSAISREVDPVRALPPTKDVAEMARRDAVLRRGEEAFRRIERLEEQLFCTVVQHEIAHQVMAGIGAVPLATTQPAWLNEGLASLFEVPLASISPGDPGVNPYRLEDFRTAAAASKMIPWERLLREDAMFRPGDPTAATAYAQAWLLTYELLREQPQKLAAYIRRARKGAAAPSERVAVFAGIFGPVDAAFDARLKAFADRLAAGGARK